MLTKYFYKVWSFLTLLLAFGFHGFAQQYKLFENIEGFKREETINLQGHRYEHFIYNDQLCYSYSQTRYGNFIIKNDTITLLEPDSIINTGFKGNDIIVKQENIFQIFNPNIEWRNVYKAFSIKNVFENKDKQNGNEIFNPIPPSRLCSTNWDSVYLTFPQKNIFIEKKYTKQGDSTLYYWYAVKMPDSTFLKALKWYYETPFKILQKDFGILYLKKQNKQLIPLYKHWKPTGGKSSKVFNLSYSQKE